MCSEKKNAMRFPYIAIEFPRPLDPHHPAHQKYPCPLGPTHPHFGGHCRWKSNGWGGFVKKNGGPEKRTQKISIVIQFIQLYISKYKSHLNHSWIENPCYNSLILLQYNAGKSFPNVCTAAKYQPFLGAGMLSSLGMYWKHLWNLHAWIILRGLTCSKYKRRLAHRIYNPPPDPGGVFLIFLPLHWTLFFELMSS